MNDNRKVSKGKTGNSRKPKNRNRQDKQDREFMSNRDDEGKGKEVNNIAWWFKNKELFEQCAQLSFQHIVGSNSPVLSTGFDPSNMMVIALNPGPGVTPTTTNPLNLNATGLNMMGLKLYQQLSMHSGRTATYAPQDVTTMILALGELLSMQEYIRRFFGLACIYNERNWTMPELVIKRLGVDSSNLFQNLAAYRMRFNTDITRINALPIISSLPYFAKCVELYTTVYTDGVSPMSSLWAYVPATTWTLDETSYSGGSILATRPVYLAANTGTAPHALRSMNELLTILEAQIDALFNSSTLQVVYSDILNLVSKNDIGLLKVDYCFETYQVGPTYSDEANMQVRHLTVVGTPDLTTYATGNTPYNDVYPNPNTNSLIYNPCWSDGSTNNGKRNHAHRLLMNFYDSGNPSLEAKIESSRFMSMFKGDSATIGSTNYAHNLLLPDHWGVAMYIFNGRFVSSPTTISATTFMWDSTDAARMVFISEYMIALEQIQNHPTMYYFDVAGNASNIRTAFVDLDFYTTVDVDYLERINRITQQTLYDYNK